MSRIKFYNRNTSSWEYADSTSGAGIDMVGYERIFYSTKRKPLEINHHDVNTSYIHGLYDALMAKYPDKVQKKEIASDDGNFTNYEYIISTGEYNTQGIRESNLDRHIKKPKYLIMGAIHGSERPTVISAYRFIKDLLEGQSALSHLAEGAVLHILPVAVPYGFDAFSYYNKDNININRDFTSELPALETQAIRNWLQDNADAALYIDLHNQSVVNEVTTIFGRADKEKKIALRGLDRIIPYWKNVIKYRETLMCRPLQGPEEAVVEQPVIFSNSVTFNVPSSAIQYASDILNIPSIALETSIYQNGDYLDWMADKQICTTETIAAGAEALGNILMEFYELHIGELFELGKYIKTINGFGPDENGNVEISNTLNHEKFFNIDYDGKISLKPEYRGALLESYASAYPLAVSDNGVNKDGSKISELPEYIIIPYMVDGENVTGLSTAAFCCNKRIKEVTLPTTVKHLPNGVFREATNLEFVRNTEQIETIGTGAFKFTKIKEAFFPNLTSLGKQTFQNCSCLRSIDIGKITTILAQAFYFCEDLTEVLGGENVTSIEKYAFYGTRKLKSLPFLSKVTSIGGVAFFGSGCDIENVPDDCVFGEYATYKQYNSTNYWNDVTFTPCKNQLNSLFHQKDPRWAEKQIGSYAFEDGTPYTYGKNGCALITLAEIYSAYEGVHFNTPEEFIPILETKGLTHLDFRYRETWCQIANGLGYETELISSMTKENLQKMYDALAQGALCYKSVGTVKDNVVQPSGGHATLVYGINSNGETLMSDTSEHRYEIGIYENHKSAWHIYKHGSEECDCVIVKKPN